MLLNQIGQDVRFFIRTLLRDRAFAAAAVITLSLGLGATTAIFSLVYGVALRPLPFPHSSRLVAIGSARPQSVGTLSLNDIRVVSGASDAIDVAACRTQRATIGPNGREHISVQSCVGDLFAVLGATPEAGRTFSGTDTRVPTVVVTHDAAAERFQGRAVGAVIEINGVPHQVIGVMPAGFSFPYDRQQDFWIAAQPFQHQEMNRTRAWIAVGRLRDGVSLERARVELQTMWARRSVPKGDRQPAIDISVIPLLDQIAGQVRPRLLLLLASVAVVLLLASINIASLLLARSHARQRELAVRAALGGSRMRLLRQMLTESLVLGVFGGIGGLTIASVTLGTIVASIPSGMPRITEIAIDLPVMAALAGVAFCAALGAGLLPALRTGRHALGPSLKESGVMTPPGRKAGQSLVALETCLALIAVVSGGLTLKSFMLLSHVDPGIDTRDVVSLVVSGEIPVRKTDALLSALVRMPGIRAASGASELPFEGWTLNCELAIEGRESAADPPVVGAVQAFPRYFATLGTRLIAGRDFREEDRDGAPPVAIINATTARRLFGGVDPIGQKIRCATPAWSEIVGVAQDARWRTLAEEAEPFVYFPLAQVGGQPASVGVIARLDPTVPMSLKELRSRVDAMAAPDAKVIRFDHLDTLVSASVQSWRFQTMLLGAFALLAFVLAVVGVFGVTSHSVSSRLREFGVRRALGARGRDIAKLAARDTAVAVTVGLAAGMGAGVLTTRALASSLFGISHTDPATYAGAAASLLIGVLIAVVGPARRATGADPVTILRAE